MPVVALFVLTPIEALGQTPAPPESVSRPAPPPPSPTVPSAVMPVFPTLPAGYSPPATLELQKFVTLTEEYSDNFNLERQNRQENFRTSLSPGLTLLIKSPLTNGIISYSPSVVYDSSAESVSVFHSLLGQVTWQPTPRLQFSVADIFTRGDEPSQADRLNLRSERRSFTSNLFALGAEQLIDRITTRESYQLSTFFGDDGTNTISHTVGGNVSVPFYQFNTASVGYAFLASETSDSSTITGHQFTGTIMRQVAGLSGGVTGSYATRSQSSSDNQDPGTNVDYQIYGGSVFAALVRGPLWLKGSVGAAVLRTDAGDEIGPLVTATAGLSYEFLRASVSLTGDRGFSETFATGQNFGVVKTQGVTASFSNSWIPATTTIVSGFYRRNEFTGIAGGTAGDESETWGGALDFRFQLTRRVTFELGYRYTERVATPRDSSYTENRGRASLSVQF